MPECTTACSTGHRTVNTGQHRTQERLRTAAAPSGSRAANAVAELQAITDSDRLNRVDKEGIRLFRRISAYLAIRRERRPRAGRATTAPGLAPRRASFSESGLISESGLMIFRVWTHDFPSLDS